MPYFDHDAYWAHEKETRPARDAEYAKKHGIHIMDEREQQFRMQKVALVVMAQTAEFDVDWVCFNKALVDIKDWVTQDEAVDLGKDVCNALSKRIKTCQTAYDYYNAVRHSFRSAAPETYGR